MTTQKPVGMSDATLYTYLSGSTAVNRPIFPILLCILAGCSSLPTLRQPRTSMKLVGDKEAMEAEVLKYLSIGMPIENAKRIMEDSGFECSDSLFEGSPCMKCSTVLKSQYMSFVNNICVRLYHDAGKLTAIEANCYTVGP